MSLPRPGCSRRSSVSVTFERSASPRISTCSAAKLFIVSEVSVGLARNSPHSSVNERSERSCSLSFRSTAKLGGIPSRSPKTSQNPTLPVRFARSARPISSRSPSLSSPPGAKLSAVSTLLFRSTPASITASDAERAPHASVVVFSLSAKTSHCMKRMLRVLAERSARPMASLARASRWKVRSMRVVGSRSMMPTFSSVWCTRISSASAGSRPGVL